MALINCSECGREFSDKAAACPQCAAPIDVAHSDSHGASTPGFTRSGLIERRSHNEILIRAPGPTAFDYVRDALVLTANSFRVSTVPLSISADFEIDKPLATAKICVLFEIPDPATTLIKIEEQSGPDLSFAASQKAIEWVAKTIIDHVAISVPREPDVTSKRGVAAGSVDYDDRQSAIEKRPPEGRRVLALLQWSILGIVMLVFVIAPLTVLVGAAAQLKGPQAVLEWAGRIGQDPLDAFMDAWVHLGSESAIKLMDSRAPDSTKMYLRSFKAHSWNGRRMHYGTTPVMDPWTGRTVDTTVYAIFPLVSVSDSSSSTGILWGLEVYIANDTRRVLFIEPVE